MIVFAYLWLCVAPLHLVFPLLEHGRLCDSEHDSEHGRLRKKILKQSLLHHLPVW